MCGIGPSAGRQLPKLQRRVRLPYFAPVRALDMSEDSFLTPRGTEGTGCAAVRRPPWIGAHRIKSPCPEVTGQGVENFEKGDQSR